MMGVRERAGGVLSGVVTAATAPAQLWTFVASAAHEGTHAVAAWPWTRDSRLHLAPLDSEAAYEADWKADVPDWALWVAHLAPTLVGTVAALLVWAWLILGGGTLPETEAGTALWLIAGANWLLFSWPSIADLSPPTGGDTRGD